MNKAILTFLMLSFSFCAIAQNRSYGQISLTASGGYITDGWTTSIGVEKVVAMSRHSIALDLQAAFQRSSVFDNNLKVLNINVPIYYGVNFYGSGLFALNAYLGAFASYYQYTPPIEIFLEKNTFFGGGITIKFRFEFYLSQTISFYLDPQLMYDFTPGANLFNNLAFKFIPCGGLRISL